MTMKKILLIDDEEDIREVAALTLETMGDFQVFAAANGVRGVEIAAAVQPDVVLLDVMMPDVDGPATLALLRKTKATREIPVIFMTAKVQASDRRRLSEFGVCGIISKPFDPMTLAGEVSDILNRRWEPTDGPMSATTVVVDDLDVRPVAPVMVQEKPGTVDLSFLIPGFIETLDERLRRMDEALQSIAGTDGEQLETVVREFHSLAGIAGTYGFHAVTQLAREGEELLKRPLSERRAIHAAEVSAARVLVSRMDALRMCSVG